MLFFKEAIKIPFEFMFFYPIFVKSPIVYIYKNRE